MEQILTNKKTIERTLSLVKHINDKYVLFKDENKTFNSDGGMKISSYYGVTTIEQLMSVKGDVSVPCDISIPNDKKNEPYLVVMITTEDLEKLKNGAVHFGHYKFPFGIENFDKEKEMVYVLARSYDFTMRDMDDKLIPLPICLNYIDGRLDNEHYDLEKVLEVIKANPSRFVTVDGGDASLIEIQPIPYYNADEGRDKFINCKYLPNDEEYNEYVYGDHYYRYDNIFDKWFGAYKKEVKY